MNAVGQVRAALRQAVGDLELSADQVAPLEHSLDRLEAPRTSEALLVEDHRMRAHPVPAAGSEGFAAFLDGTQQSLPLSYHRGAPIVLGTVAAVIRERRLRRLTTWGAQPRVARALYLSRAAVGEGSWERLRQLGLTLVDIGCAELAEHPYAVALRARELVQNDRERLEHALAEEWVQSEDRSLLVNGGLRGSGMVASSPHAVGVVKSHRTLYAVGEALAVVLALPAGFRSSVFRVETGGRQPVLSWYLRLRDAVGRGPFFGLVRLEVALTEHVSARAAEISRLVLAEMRPLALPDDRWHSLLYPVRDCEQYLRAVVG